MNQQAACRLLAIAPDAGAREVREAYERRASQLVRERELAITRSLRERIEQDLATLRRARDLLLGGRDTQPPDAGELPLTSPPDPAGATPTPAAYSSTGNARVLDRYDIGEKLGSGGMGEVFAAFDRLTSQPVAIKFISGRISARADALQRFLSEARLSCRLSHPNIVRTFDVHEAGGRYFITMELLEGHTLRQHIATRIASGRRFERTEVHAIMHQVCAALAYAHRDLVHRDIKPENVWRCADGTIKLMDFGVALDVAAADLAESSAALGTEGYRAPEQATGADPVDQRADQYAAACIAVELLAAPSPCRPAQLRADAVARGDPLRGVLERALAGRAGDRYPNILEFESALRVALLRPRWRRRLPLVAAALVIVLLATAGWYALRAPPPATPTATSRPQDALLGAHARLGEARAMLEALDSIVADSRQQVERLRGELERTRPGAAQDTEGEREARERALEDAEALAMRAARWALMGDERIRVEGLLEAAQAALEQERHADAQAQAVAALELLRASRTHLLSLGAQLQSLRDLQARADALLGRLGAAAPAGLASELAQDWLAARDALLDGEPARALALREALAERVRAAGADAETLLRGHWQAQATQALRRGDLAQARRAIGFIEGTRGGEEAARQLRAALAARERGLRAAQAARDQAAREQQELEREQSAYRPGSGG